MDPEGLDSPRGDNWNPQLLRGDRLQQWAAATAEMTAAMMLAGPRDETTASCLAESICDGASRAMDGSPQKLCRECQPGCPGCCHVMIGVTPPEVIAISDYIHRELPDREAEVRSRAGRNSDATATLDHHQYADAKVPCPLLDDAGNCSAYPRRPLRCRAWCSLSVDRCRECYAGSLVHDRLPIDAHAYTVGAGAVQGLSAGIQASGLDGEVYELNSALAAALDQPHVAADWAAGRDVFSSCKRYK